MQTSDIIALAGIIIVVGGAIIGMFLSIQKSLARLDEKVDGTFQPRIDKLEHNDVEHFDAEKSLDKRVTILETQHIKTRA